MTTPELVDVLLRDIDRHGMTTLRAKKMLRHLESPDQLSAVLILLPMDVQQMVAGTLTPSVVDQHFKSRKH